MLSRVDISIRLHQGTFTYLLWNVMSQWNMLKNKMPYVLLLLLSIHWRNWLSVHTQLSWRKHFQRLPQKFLCWDPRWWSAQEWISSVKFPHVTQWSIQLTRLQLWLLFHGRDQELCIDLFKKHFFSYYFCLKQVNRLGGFGLYFWEERR